MKLNSVNINNNSNNVKSTYKQLDLERIFDGYVPDIISSQKVIVSSVVLPVINIDGEESILLEVRGNNLKHQPGEISFPGGRVEQNENPKNAAIREFCEELMCGENSINIITKLNQYIAPAKGVIYTYLGRAINIDLNIKNDEVEKLITVPISFFKKTKPMVYHNKVYTKASSDFPFEEMNISTRYFDYTFENEVIFYKYEQHVIWGITAHIIRDFITKI